MAVGDGLPWPTIGVHYTPGRQYQMLKHMVLWSLRADSTHSYCPRPILCPALSTNVQTFRYIVSFLPSYVPIAKQLLHLTNQYY